MSTQVRTTLPPLPPGWSSFISVLPAVARTVPSVTRTVILGGISKIISRGGDSATHGAAATTSAPMDFSNFTAASAVPPVASRIVASCRTSPSIITPLAPAVIGSRKRMRRTPPSPPRQRPAPPEP